MKWSARPSLVSAIISGIEISRIAALVLVLDLGGGCGFESHHGFGRNQGCRTAASADGSAGIEISGTGWRPYAGDRSGDAAGTVPWASSPMSLTRISGGR